MNTAKRREFGHLAALKTIDYLILRLSPRALCVVDTFFTEKNLLNALLIGVTFFFFYYKKWFQTLKNTILKGLFNCVVIANVIYNFKNGFLVP